MSETQVRWRPGKPLVRVLVIVVVLAIIIGIGLPAVLYARNKAAERTTMENLSKCAKAVHLAHDQHKKFPPYYGPYGDNTTPLTFHAHLLPFVGEQPLYDKLIATAAVPAYLAPLDPTRTDGGAGTVNFPVNIRLFYTQLGMGSPSVWPNTIYPRIPNTFQGQGTSNTLLFATKYQHCGANGGSLWNDPSNNVPTSPTAATFGVSMDLWQPAPTQAQCDPIAGTAVSFNAHNIAIGLCDASVRTVSSSVSRATWRAVHLPSVIPEGPDWDKIDNSDARQRNR